MYFGIIPIVGVAIGIVLYVFKTRPGPYPDTLGKKSEWGSPIEY